MRCRWEWLHFPISPQQQVSLTGKIKMREKKNWEHNKKLPQYKKCADECDCISWSLTIHLDLEGDGCIGQVTLCIKGVLSLLLRVHSLQLETSLVSKKRRHFRLRKREKSSKWLILWFEPRQLCIIVHFVNRGNVWLCFSLSNSSKMHRQCALYLEWLPRLVYFCIGLLSSNCTDLLLYLTSFCSCVEVLGEVGVCHLCSMMWGYASIVTLSSRSSPSFTSINRPWWVSFGDSWGNSRM